MLNSPAPISVAHILRKYDPREWGGTETAICQLLDGLRAHGVDSTVYCPAIEDTARPDPLADSGHPVVRFNAFVPVLGLSAQQRRQRIAVGGNLMSFDLVTRLLRRPDLSLVHVHTLGRIGGIGRFIAKRRGLPLVVTIHGGVLDLPKETEEKLREVSTGGWEYGKLFGFLLKARRVLEDAGAIITLNPREAELLREKYPHKRVIVLPHGIPMAAYETEHRAAALAAFPQLQHRRVLLVLGRIDPVKNQLWLIQQAPRILQKFPDALLVFVGAATDPTYDTTIRQTIEHLGLSNNVLLTGGVPPRSPQLIGLLQSASVVIVPSHSETFGLVLLEAWAAGAAVIASNTSGARQVIRHGENGWLFGLDDPDAFHRALQDTLSDPQRSAQRVEAGRRLVREEYDNLAITARVKNLYAELLEKKRA